MKYLNFKTFGSKPFFPSKKPHCTHVDLFSPKSCILHKSHFGRVVGIFSTLRKYLLNGGNLYHSTYNLRISRDKIYTLAALKSRIQSISKYLTEIFQRKLSDNSS